ncbi:hypothetical protein M0P65_04900 [Candidatus Gracilibacteria bacterium]|nr:hypothetical protein [Candidatus Gracilibacteria bacterium]
MITSRNVSLIPLGNKEKQFILDNLLKDSKRSIANFYKKEVANNLVSLREGAKLIGANKKIVNLVEKDIKKVAINSDKVIEKIKKLENKGVKTFNELSKIIKDAIKNDPILDMDIKINIFDTIINELISIYLFVEKDNVNSLVNETKTRAELLLNSEISAIMREIKNKLDIVFDFYGASNFYKEKLSSEVEDLTMDIRLLKLQLEEKEKEIKSINREKRKTETSLKSKEDEAERLRQDKEKLNKKIEELEKELASKEIEEQNIKSQKNSIISSEDNLVWEELAHKTEFKLGKTKQELQEVKKENTQLLEQNQSLIGQVQSMENLKIRFTEFSTIEAFLDQCEADIEDLDADEMIRYLSLINCPINLKQKAIKVVIHFIDEILLKHIVKCTSSTTHSNGGAGGGLYANNFIKPIMNFVKQNGKIMGTQEFLEYLTSINWGNLISEYKKTPDYKTKKDKIFANINFHLGNDNNYRGIFEALGFLSDKLKDFSVGGTDLNLLSQNIKDYINNTDYTKNELKKLVTKASLSRRNN